MNQQILYCGIDISADSFNICYLQPTGISSAWTTVRLYSGKQLEVDNVVIDSSQQSKGLGKLFFEFIENWAKKNEYKTIELNTYVQNSKSHKFYYNLGYSILGFHFWKHI